MKTYLFLFLSAALFLTSCGGPEPEVADNTDQDIPENIDTTAVSTIDFEIISQLQNFELENYSFDQSKYVDSPEFQPKIIGGKYAREGQFPWQVALIYSGYAPERGQFCGGTIIHEEWIVTAAHCLESATPNGIQVFSGSLDLAGTGQVTDVAEIIIHPDYNQGVNLNNDIALIRLATPLVYDVNTATIPLNLDPNFGLPDKDLVTVSGWGVSETASNGTIGLKYVDVELVSPPRCMMSYGSAVTGKMLCAGFDVGGKDACQGDSGGPLIYSHNGENVLVGVVSWGHGCAEPKQYGVYTRVSEYKDWITENVGTENIAQL